MGERFEQGVRLSGRVRRRRPLSVPVAIRRPAPPISNSGLTDGTADN